MKWEPRIERLFSKLYLIYEKLEQTEKELETNKCIQLQKKRDALIIMKERITNKLRNTK